MDSVAVSRHKQELRGAGLRATSGRLAVLRVLETAPHSTAETVFELISGDLPGTSPQAVYMVLNDLTRAGLTRRFEPAGSAARYERRIGDNHHHLVCDGCGRVQDVDCAIGAAPCLSPSGTDGFQVREAEVTFWGTCTDCQGVTVKIAEPKGNSPGFSPRGQEPSAAAVKPADSGDARTFEHRRLLEHDAPIGEDAASLSRSRPAGTR